VKGKFPLHSQCVQAVCHKYLQSRDSAKKSKNKEIASSRYPYRKKKYFNTKWVDKAFTIFSNGRIELSMGIQNGKRVKPLVLYAKNLPEGDIKEIELCYDRKLYLSISYCDGMEPVENNHTDSVGVDLGEIHSIASFHENGESIVISGRKLRSIHRLRNKKLGELQRKMSKCKKGSRQWKKYNKVKQFILSKSEQQIQDANHKITKSFIEWCIKQNVKTIYVGDVSSVSKKAKKKRKANRTQRQKLSNWNVGKQVTYLTYKGEAKGMLLKLVNEAYSTQTCPVCHSKKKPKGRTYSCHCNYSRHRDVHGASNILSEQLYVAYTFIPMNQETKYLRVA